MKLTYDKQYSMWYLESKELMVWDHDLNKVINIYFDLTKHDKIVNTPRLPKNLLDISAELVDTYPRN